MANKEMYDYLSTISADYTGETLTLTSIRPQDIIFEDPVSNQIPLMGDDASMEVNSLDDGTIYFWITYKFNHKSSEDIGTLLDIIMNSSKANFRANTIQVVDPEDGHTYVMRYWSGLKRGRGRPSFHSVPSVTFRVEGRIAD